MHIHYYMPCLRFEALIASHLDPEAFGTYMAVGTKKLASGRVMFFEIDPAEIAPEVARDVFHLETVPERCQPHADGSPKRSKYIGVYRVMEHVPLAAYKRLFLTTSDGRTLGLDPSPYDVAGEGDGPNLYQELCPLLPMVVSLLPPARFLRSMTDPASPISAPRLCMADLLIERDAQGQLAGHLPYSDPHHIADCLRELETKGDKPTKTVSRTPRLQGMFRAIRRGIFIGDQGGVKHFRFPSVDELEVRHSRWWNSAKHN